MRILLHITTHSTNSTSALSYNSREAALTPLSRSEQSNGGCPSTQLLQVSQAACAMNKPDERVDVTRCCRYNEPVWFSGHAEGYPDMQSGLRCVLFLSFILCADCLSGQTDHAATVEDRKRAFLVQLADGWMQEGYPIAWKHEEWKFNEIEPHWAGALAALRLARSPTEIAQANAFFSAMPLDEKIDPDMRVCEALHSYYLFRDDPKLEFRGARASAETGAFQTRAAQA